MLLVIMDAIIMFWLNKQWHSLSNGYKNQSSLCECLPAIPRKHIEHPIDITSVVFSIITSTFGTIQAIIFGIRDKIDVCRCKCDVCSQNVLFCARSEWEFSRFCTFSRICKTFTKWLRFWEPKIVLLRSNSAATFLIFLNNLQFCTHSRHSPVPFL